MNIFNKALIIVLLPILVLTGNNSQAADLPDEQFTVSAPPTNDRYTGINLADESFAKNSASLLEAMTSKGTSRSSVIESKTACSAVGLPGCEVNKYFQYNALIGACDSELTTNCINKVFAIDSTGKEITGRVVGTFPGKTKYKCS